MSITGGPPLKASVSQSAAEVRAFVASLKGKTPAEAMGAVAHSRLLRGMFLSLVIQVVLVLLLTVPYALWPKSAPAAGTTPARVPATRVAVETPTAPTQPAVEPAERVERPATTPERTTGGGDTKPVRPPTGDVEDLIDSESLGE